MEVIPSGLLDKVTYITPYFDNCVLKLCQLYKSRLEDRMYQKHCAYVSIYVCIPKTYVGVGAGIPAPQISAELV